MIQEIHILLQYALHVEIRYIDNIQFKFQSSDNQIGDILISFKVNFKDCKNIDLTRLVVDITITPTWTSYQKLLCIG